MCAFVTGRLRELSGLALWGGVAVAMALASAAVAQTEPESEPEPKQITQQDRDERRRQVDEAIARTTELINRDQLTYDRLIENVATPLREHGCEALLLHLAPMQRLFETLYPLAAAHLILEGRCFAREPVAAQKLIATRLAKKPTDYEALGLMGALYHHGLGVVRDETLARVYFKKAALRAGWWILRADDAPTLMWSRKIVDFWEVSIDDYRLLLINNVTGPWALPEPLRKDIEWVRSVKEEGPQAIMRVAFDLRRGSGGLPRDAALAYRWLHTLAVSYNFIPSYYPFAMWTRERNFTEKRQALGDIWSREIELGTANQKLIGAARDGDRRASPVIYRLLLQTPDYDRRDWAIYYWLLRMRRDGHVVDDDAIDKAAAALSAEDREMVEGWGDYELPPFTQPAKIEWRSD